MRKVTYLALPLFLTVCDVEPAFADPDPAPTVEDVIAMMKVIPEKSRPSRPGRYDQAGDAREIAAGIARVARDRPMAAHMAVYAAYESSMQKCVGGDKNAEGEPQSWGAWQLKYVPKEVACDPARAASIWLSLARNAEATCKDSPPEDRLAPLAGGSCNRGRLVARTRARIAKQIAQSE